MPTYVYCCLQCDLEFEVIQRMNDLAVADCPVCEKIVSDRVPQVFSVVDSTPKTLGSLAEQNRSRMSNAQYQERLLKLREQQREAVKYKGQLPEGAEVVDKPTTRPWYRPDRNDADLPLAKALSKNPEYAERYIQTGKRPFGA